MDPKSIANLDPKLRETYERVMGNSDAASSSPAPATDNKPAEAGPTVPTPAPETPAAPANSTTHTPDFSKPVSPEPQLSSSMPGSTTPVSAAPATSSAAPYSPADLGLNTSPSLTDTSAMQPLASPASVAQASQGSGSTIKLLYILGGVVFFIVYVFFWIKIFNYQLPF